MSESFQQIKDLAKEAFAEHELTVRLPEQPGPFRSYRCQRPKSWIYGFDVTFTPGWVYLSGDIGHLALSRETDMLPWLRGTLLKESISLGYVAEKTARDIQNRTWSEWAAKRMLGRIFEDSVIPKSDQSRLMRKVDDSYEWETSIVPELLDLGIHDYYEYGDACDWNGNFCWCVLGLKWCVEAIDKITRVTLTPNNET